MENSTFSIKKVQKRSAEVQAADVLREAIISGNVPLGSRLTEISASEQLEVSRSTIRAAFHQLVQEGLLIQVPYTGWTVMTLSPEDAWELYTLRASLEALAASLVASQVREGKRVEFIHSSLDKAFTKLKQACHLGQKRTIAAEDMNLHKKIIELSGHNRLLDQYTRIQHQILIYIQSSNALMAEPEQIISQHEPLIATLQAGDIDAATRAAMQHNETEGKILVEYLYNYIPSNRV